MPLDEKDKAWLSAKFAEYATKADLERVETALLTEFHKWASPNEARQRRYSAELQEFELELQRIDDRLKKLESKSGGAQ